MNAEPISDSTCKPGGMPVFWLIGTLLLGGFDLGPLQAEVESHPDETLTGQYPRSAAVDVGLDERPDPDPLESRSLLDQARYWHDLGVEGDVNAVVEAVKRLEQLVASEPDHAMARMLLGSALTLRARDLRFPTTRMRYAREGLAHMDAAVVMDPEDVELRFARAANNWELPRFMKREPVAFADAQWLWNRVRQEERAGLATDNGFRQQVARLYGQMLVSRNDSKQAVAVWKEGYSWDTNSTFGKLLLKDSTEEHTGAK